jgi:hypothetical protein
MAGCLLLIPELIGKLVSASSRMELASKQLAA